MRSKVNISPGILLAFLAVFILGTASAATAGSLINGKKIKKGSIPYSALSKDAKKQLAKSSKAGPQGPAGPAGASAARYWAFVSEGGSVGRSSGGISSTYETNGGTNKLYVVTFPTDVSQCAYQVTTGDTTPIGNAMAVDGTVALLEACRDVGVGRVVFASSATVYGQQPVQPVTEDTPSRPAVPYAVSKVAAEQYLFTMGQLDNFETVSLRIFNAYGPGQALPPSHAPVIPYIMQQVAQNASVVVYGDGRQTRDFVYVSDVVKRWSAPPLPAVSTGKSSTLAGAWKPVLPRWRTRSKPSPATNYIVFTIQKKQAVCPVWWRTSAAPKCCWAFGRWSGWQRGWQGFYVRTAVFVMRERQLMVPAKRLCNNGVV